MSELPWRTWDCVMQPNMGAVLGGFVVSVTDLDTLLPRLPKIVHHILGGLVGAAIKNSYGFSAPVQSFNLFMTSLWNTVVSTIKGNPNYDHLWNTSCIVLLSASGGQLGQTRQIREMVPKWVPRYNPDSGKIPMV